MLGKPLGMTDEAPIAGLSAGDSSLENTRLDRARKLAAYVEEQAKHWYISVILKVPKMDDDRRWEMIERAHRAALAIPLVAEYAEALMLKVRAEVVAKHALEVLGWDRMTRGDDNDPDASDAEPHDRAKAFMDNGSSDRAWPPSAMFEIARTALRTGWLNDPETSRLQARRNAEQFERWAIETARERWRQGFYADPFTNQPKRRDMAA